MKKDSIAREQPRKVFIVEDHPVFRQGLIQMVNGEKDLAVCGQTDEAELAWEAICRLKPDLVLVDLTLGGKNGLELIKEIRGANCKVKILVVSMHDEALYAERVLRAGGDGYIMKQEDPDEIIHAMRDVLAGHLYVSDMVLAHSSDGSRKNRSAPKPRVIDQLTDSELEILELIGKGKSPGVIARQLQVSNAEITSRRDQMKKKLNLKSESALIRYAVCWVETGAA